MLRQREVAHNQPHAIAKLLNDPLNNRMLQRTTRTLIISKLNDRHSRLRISLRRLIVSRDLKHRRLRSTQIDLNLRRASQLVGERERRVVLFRLLHILNNQRFGLREIAANTIFVFVIERLRLRLCDARHFRHHLGIEQRTRGHLSLLRLLRQQRVVDLHVEVLLAKCINLFLHVEDQRTEAVFDVAHRDLLVVDGRQHAGTICGSGSRLIGLGDNFDLRSSSQPFGKLLRLLLLALVAEELNDVVLVVFEFSLDPGFVLVVKRLRLGVGRCLDLGNHVVFDDL